MIKEQKDLDWQKAYNFLKFREKKYPVLARDLLCRFYSGERSRDLYYKIMSL